MNLIIGDTSQLSYFFPNDYIRISARNINFNDFNNKNFNRVYILCAEQRTFNKDLTEKDFFDVNVTLTSKIIDFFSPISKKIIVYGTTELWNMHNGPIDLSTEIMYHYSPYIKSKEILYEKVIENRINKWNNVIILHPFNFNSLHRKEGFLFYKIFNSLINNEKIEIGNININRDIIHTNFLVKKSLYLEYDSMIGSGILTNIQKFISDIFNFYNKKYEDYVIYDNSDYSQHKSNEFWLKTDNKYNNLFSDTINEINEKI
jgi:nucleoside-diphosphate-sugar epimerase